MSRCDIGVGDATAIWFVQAVGRMFHVIEYLEASDHGLEWYAKVLKEKPYTLWPALFSPRHRGPGLSVVTGAPAGHGRELRAAALGRGPTGRYWPTASQAVRTMFPRFLFDSEKCYEGLEALKAYRRAWNETQ